MPFCITCGAAVADDDGFCSSCGATTQERTTAVPSDVSQPPLRDTQWHYSTRGERLGPVSEAQIVELIGQRTITEESLVWDSTMADWQPVLASRFAYLVRDPNIPPPLTGGAVSNTIIWLLAFAPLIGVLLEAFFSAITGIAATSLWFVTLLLNVVLSYADAKKLKAAGHDTDKMGAVWLVPVYLFKRAQALKHNYAYFIVWCVLFGLLLMA